MVCLHETSSSVKNARTTFTYTLYSSPRIIVELIFLYLEIYNVIGPGELAMPGCHTTKRNKARHLEHITHYTSSLNILYRHYI